ncbi:peptidyl-prolyl cis-trans isomerase [Massilia sp. H-1]|nr:peptidyl-prolyl cis-trans isomerase [Massilia sp. H-1]
MRRATRAATWSKRATFCSRSRRAFRSTCCAPRAKRCWTNWKQHPERFAELAGAYSNCVSGKVGGSLGQLAKGQSVPEFDALLFRLAEGELAPAPARKPATACTSSRCKGRWRAACCRSRQ